MTEIFAYICSPALLLLLTLWLLLGRRHSGRNRPQSISACLAIDERLLSETESRLVEYDAMLKRIQAEQREAALSYLREVHDSFLRVETLLNQAAKFLPELTLKGETERILLGIRFRFTYHVARQEVRLGLVPAAGLKALVAKLRLASAWARGALEEVSRVHGLPVLESDLRVGN
jgi:hypothetical protein